MPLHKGNDGLAARRADGAPEVMAGAVERHRNLGGIVGDFLFADVALRDGH